MPPTFLRRGRGTFHNLPNRFERVLVEPEPSESEESSSSLLTQFLKDRTRKILSTNESPDVGFEVSLNPYRGCEHGCVYCYARPTHEYLGFSSGLDFESKILIKENAPELLRKQLSSAGWKPKVIAMSGVTDPYQPVEHRLQITRRCLEVLVEFRNPVAIVTKNALVTRDLDLLSELAQFRAAAVYLSVTTLDNSLRKLLEPRTSPPARRLEAIERLREAQIPVGVLVAPVIPALNEAEIPAILNAAARAGAEFAGYVTLRLPYGVKNLFEEWLTQYFPERKERILHRIRAMRGGELNSSEFGSRMQGEGIFAQNLAALFAISRRKAGISEKGPRLSTEAFRRFERKQLELF